MNAHSAAALLRLGDDVVDQRGLTGRLWTEDLDDTPLGHAAYAERVVERQRAGRDDVLHLGGLVPQPHDRALAKGLFNVAQGCVERLLLLCQFFAHVCCS